MTVYVDDARVHYRGCLMSHMFADSIGELHSFAAQLRLGKWAYTRGEVLAHYNVSQSKRAAAIAAGAVEVDQEWLRSRIRAEVARIEARRARRSASWLGLKVPLR